MRPLSCLLAPLVGPIALGVVSDATAQGTPDWNRRVESLSVQPTARPS
jgi:hypothetical protein